MDEIKFVIDQLNKEPFNYNFNLVSYDNLNGEQRIELLFKVFKEIDQKITFDSIHLADPEEIVMIILENLRIMKYSPPTNLNASEFRRSLILGDRILMTNILWWLLSRLPALKKRAYLAQYLVKVKLSPEVEGDHDILLLYQQYLKLIEDFKTVHTSYENLNKTVGSVQEVQKDLKAMEQEKEQISEKLVNIKRRIDPTTKPQLFSMIQIYRDEKELNEKLSKQVATLDHQNHELAQIHQRFSNQLKEAESAFHSGTSPEDLIVKLEEEIKVKRNLIEKVLPKELNQLKQYVKDLEEIDLQPKMGQSYLDNLIVKIRAVNSEINQIVEQKMLKSDPLEDKLTLFRQNASAVAEKRSSMSAKIKATEQELGKLKQQLETKKSGLQGNVPLKGEALKEYITQLRNKSSVYKKKRNELMEYKTEAEVMQQTLNLLKSQEREIMENLQNLEEQKGIAGYFSMQEISGVDLVDNDQVKNSDELNVIIKKLAEQINEKKVLLAPKIKDLRPLRQKCQDMQFEFEQKKQTYDNQAVGLKSRANQLEQEVERSKEELQSLESANYLTKCQIEVLEAQQQFLEEQMKLFVSQDTEKKENSILEVLKSEIAFQEGKSQELKKLQKELRDNESAIKKQAKMWKDLQMLFEVKKRCLQSQVANKSEFNSEGKSQSDYLLLS